MKTTKKPLAVLLAVILTFVMAAAAFPVSALDGTLAVTGSVSSAYIGDTVAVTVSMQNNPGLISLMMSVHYDTAALELIGIDNRTLFQPIQNSNPEFLQSNDLTASPYAVMWCDDLAPQNHTENGDLITYYFRVRNTAQVGLTTVSLSYNAGNTLDYDLQPVALTAGSFGIQIQANPGDANGDGEITAYDVISMVQAINNPLLPDLAGINMDLDGDGDMDMDDVMLLRQMLVD